MDCRGFLDRLEDFLEGKLTGAERRAAERHLGGCPSCREFEGLTHPELPLGEPPGNLAGSIFELTSGSPCTRAEGLLCDHVDGRTQPVDAELMRLHLDRCADCAALTRVLARMSEELPSLAEIAPDPAFVNDVLRATLPAHTRWTRRLVRWSEAWRQVLQRPRIAWEGAYLGTFVLAVIFWVPGSPLAAVPQKALELARTNPAEELKVPVAEIETRISNGLQDAWRVTVRKAGGAFERIKTDLGTVWDRLASEKETDEEEAQGDRK